MQRRAVRIWTSKRLVPVAPAVVDNAETAQVRRALETVRRLRCGWRPGRRVLAAARRAEQWSATRRADVAVYQFIGSQTQLPASAVTIATVLALDAAEGWALLFGDRWVRLGAPAAEAPPADPLDIARCAEAWLLSQLPESSNISMK